MPRNRVIYQSEALFVGPSPSTGIHFHNYSGLTGEAGTWSNAIHTLDAKFGNQLSASGETALLTVFTGASGSNAVGDVYRFGPDGGISAIGAGKTQTLTFTGGNRVEQLHRIQSCNYSFNIARTDVNQFGELAAIDRVVLESPTVSLDFSYVLANFANEKKLGFDIVQGSQGTLFKGGLGISCLSGILTKKEDERNYFIKTVDEGFDAKDHESTRLGGGSAVKGYGDSVIALGNGFMTSYSSEASVGAMPTVSINVEALNMCFEYGSTAKKTPSINPADGTRRSEVYSLPTAGSNPGTGNLSISVLRPGDITFSFKKREHILAGGGGLESTPSLDYDVPGPDLDDVKIQSYSIGFDISREPIQKLGSRFAFSREITFPVTVTCSIDALVGDLNSGNLGDMINCDDAYDIKVNLKNPAGCSVDSTQTVCEYNLRQAKVNSQSYTSDIGSNKSVTLEFAAQIGGPNQNYVGLFLSGVATNKYSRVGELSVDNS